MYHNARCSKSRKVLSILKENNIKCEIIDYTKNPLNYKKIISILKKLNMKPIDLIRKKETIWKELTKNKQLNNTQIIESMIAHPKLIERPIIVKKNKAIIGRPVENIFKLI